MNSNAPSNSNSADSPNGRSDLLRHPKNPGVLVDEPHRVAEMETIWTWSYVPWIKALLFVLAGCASVAVGTVVNMHPYVMGPWFRAAFIGLGVLHIFGAFFLSGTKLCIGSDKTLYRISGPWIGIRSKTHGIPLDSVSRIVHRWRYFGSGNEKSGVTHRMLLQTSKGDEYDIFPVDNLPSFPDRCGRSLAEFLCVEFCHDEDKN